MLKLKNYKLIPKSFRSNLRKMIPNYIINFLDNNLIDSYIISYPKCGRTWLRMIIGTYLDKKFGLNLEMSQLSEIQKFKNYDKRIPFMRVTHLGDPHLKKQENWKIDINKIKRKKIIFLCRDPRPTIVSYYNQFVYRGDKEKSEDPNFEGDVNKFIKNQVGGLNSLIEYYNIFAELSSKSEYQILILKYEDLKSNTFAQVSRILKFLDIEIDEQILIHSIEFNDSENLRKLEKEGVLNSVRFGGNNKNSMKVRNVGKIPWHQEINQSSFRILENEINEKLSKIFNY